MEGIAGVVKCIARLGTVEKVVSVLSLVEMEIVGHDFTRPNVAKLVFIEGVIV